MSLPKSESEYLAFIRRFEASKIPREEWRHAEHVAIAFWYLSHFDEATAVEKIRTGIMNLNSANGVPQTATGGYHETWTLFFARVLNRYIQQELNLELPLLERMNRSVHFLADFKEITREYYSPKLIMSWEARTTWQEPDLKNL